MLAPRATAVLVTLAALILFAPPLEAQEVTRRLVDGIAAVVGDEIILESEVDEELYIYQMRTGNTEISEGEVARIRGEILLEMVDEMLLVAMARRDTITLEPRELEEEMDRRVSELEERHGSRAALNAALAAEGITLAELRDLYRDEIERRLLAQKVVRNEIHSKIDVTWGEVESYYEEHAEDVARRPEAYEIVGILVTPRVSEAAKERGVARMMEVTERLAGGEPFEELARECSDDASAVSGGDLGTFGRGVMVPEFEDAVFALGEGEVSGIVPTRFGFHVVQVLEKWDDKVHARHILARVTVGPDDEARAKASAESLRQRVIAGEDFAGLAERRSDDPISRANGGVLGWFAVDDLAPFFRSVIEGLSVGDVAEVVAGDTGFYVLKLLNHEEERTAGLDEVREDLRDHLFGRKAEESYVGLMERLKREIFVDIRTDVVPEE